MILPGTYHNGFAPRDGEPLYPELQVGCVGDWSPGLGPTGTVLRDWSGRANHGTLTNMVGADWTPSGGRYALNFDAVDNYVAVPYSAHINPASTLSVAFWMYHDDASTSIEVPIELAAGADELYFVLYRGDLTPKKWHFGIRQSNNVYIEPQIDESLAPPGGWYHLAFCADGTNIRTHVNGITQSTTAYNGTLKQNAAASLAIGKNPGGARYFDGAIDDVRIYSRGLSQYEVKLLALRRGIAHELAPVRYAGSAGFLAAWRRQQSFIIGGGLQ